MRKTSDIALLLGSRSKSRSRGSRGGFGSSMVGMLDGLLGRVSRGRRREQRSSVSMMVLVICVLVAFGGGFLIGDRFGGGDGSDPLNASLGQKPGFLKEFDTTPLADQAFVVSAFPIDGGSEEEARQKAVDLARFLVQAGIEKARAYPWPQSQGVLWVTVVYYADDREMAATRAALLRVENVPDKRFVQDRNTDSEWPLATQIR
ncbi:MAG: hypothetical protein KAI24_06205 [Planctomycetes bacterium]|nr:hypothetical protein [Planctomycetota bacterium]